MTPLLTAAARVPVPGDGSPAARHHPPDPPGNHPGLPVRDPARTDPGGRTRPKLGLLYVVPVGTAHRHGPFNTLHAAVTFLDTTVAADPRPPPPSPASKPG